eukprot:CAMPEP_0117602164 /NCGR_PEP_ID=MMETSP0784-20121206/77427_1 /TAXON_ID=39447 /ORGANISM="" /LENGTH=301 /DNA_ID=CAMNT_0005404949 /DNA_START=29 /DNA_END=931 /DNA_ORIENTATION=-
MAERSLRDSSRLSQSAILEQSDVPTFAMEPGPGHYYNAESRCFSSLGQQRLAKNASAPEIHFAHTGWDDWKKIVISKQHEGAMKCRESPGCTYVDSSMGGVSAKIGTSQRADMSEGLGKDSPGPMYSLPDGMSKANTLPAAKSMESFPCGGAAPRFAREKGKVGPGPGGYHRADASVNGSTGRSFGNGRAAWEKVIKPGLEKDGVCKLSPGVGPPLWRDLKKDGKMAFSMGRADRFPESKASTVPGPGHYRQDERSTSLNALNRSGSICADTRRPGTMKFGAKPKKPRFRIQLASATSERG